MDTFPKSVCILLGGGIGSYLRYVLQGWIQGRAGTGFPYGTLVVNLSGAFLIGLAMTVFLEHFEVNPLWRLFLTVGVLGGFTTFSSAAWETYQLVALGSPMQALLYIVGSVLGGGVGILLGVWLGRLI